MADSDEPLIPSSYKELGDCHVVQVSEIQMIGSAIRELSAARTVPLICAGFVESTVQIWDLLTQQKTGEFAAHFEFGSTNLALHPGGESVVTGISAKRGSIASYKVPNGELIWLRDRLPDPGRIRFSQSGKHVSFSFNTRRIERVDALTGNTTEVLRQIDHYIEGPNGYALTVPSTGSTYLLRKEHEIPIPKLTFAVLDVAFGPDRLCITESTGPVRCLDYLTGAEHWRYTPLEGSHVLGLHYNRLDDFFYGVVWHYEKGQFRYLARFDAETSQPTRLRSLSSWEEVFSEATQQLVTSSGEIIDLSSGEIAGELAFPRKEYPDRFTVT